MQTPRSLALFVVAFLCCRPIAANERPVEQKANEIFNLLVAKKFAQLQKLDEQSRDLAQKTADGQSLRAAFYGGVSGCLTMGCPNDRTPEYFDYQHERLIEWKSAYPESITPSLAEAGFFLERAWAIRGNSPAAGVQKESWAGFREYVGKAATAIDALPAAAKNDPAWFATKLGIFIAATEKTAEVDKVFNEAIRRHPDYLPLYFAYTAYYSPRWYGSPKVLRQKIDGITKAHSSPFSDVLYARLNWNVHTKSMFEDGQAEWLKMKKGFEAIVAENPHDWNIQNYARFACLAKDAATAATLLPRFEKANPRAWNWDQALFESCKELAIKVKR